MTAAFRKQGSKYLVVLLIFALILSLLPMHALAANTAEESIPLVSSSDTEGDAALSKDVQFTFGVGLLMRKNLWGIPMSDINKPYDYMLTIYSDEDDEGNPINQIAQAAETNITSKPQDCKTMEFSCAPGVLFFDLRYKLHTQDEYTPVGSGRFLVEEDAKNTQEFFLSTCSITTVRLINDPEKPGYTIEVYDPLLRKVTPQSTILADPENPNGGDGSHKYLTVATTEDKPYTYVVTPSIRNTARSAAFLAGSPIIHRMQSGVTATTQPRAKRRRNLPRYARRRDTRLS